MHFGYHVEHHLFPTISGPKLVHVHNALKKNFPDKYKMVPKFQALKALYSTPRIYKDNGTLVHPETQTTTDIASLFGQQSLSQTVSGTTNS